MPFVHWSPKQVAVGDWVVPLAEIGGPSRSFGADYAYAVDRGMYDPHLVYVLETDELDPWQWFGRFGFTRPEHYMYEVEPEVLGDDPDIGHIAMNSRTCLRARVIRCLHTPSATPLTITTD